MSERRTKALQILSKMLPPEIFTQVKKEGPAAKFADEMSDLALNSVFEPLWTDDRLDLRTRSLITVAILVALRSEEELAIHVPAAIRNGATVAEIEQLIYQAAGYAGFPAASTARNVAAKALSAAGML
jgi:4-carboxymuconolactone decarboxylase